MPVVGRRLDELQTLLSLFREAPQWEICLLEGDSARRLITKPAEGVLVLHARSHTSHLPFLGARFHRLAIHFFARHENSKNPRSSLLMSKVGRESDCQGEGGLVLRQDYLFL